MTRENNGTLLPILCGYLPYGLKVLYISGDGINTYVCGVDMISIASETVGIYQIPEPRPQVIWRGVETIKPYLRPLSSMTEEEYNELKEIEPYYGIAPFEFIDDWGPNYEVIVWLNSHHFDYMGLIKEGLALEAPADMYVLD